MVRGEHSPMSHHHLVTRDHRRLTDEETAAVVAEAKAEGLIATADKHNLSPVELYAAVTRAGNKGE